MPSYQKLSKKTIVTFSGNLNTVICIDFEEELFKQMKQLNSLNIPVLFTKKDTFSVASKLGSLIVKISPRDNIKVDNACQLMEKYLDMDKITAQLAI